MPRADVEVLDKEEEPANFVPVEGARALINSLLGGQGMHACME